MTSNSTTILFKLMEKVDNINIHIEENYYLDMCKDMKLLYDSVKKEHKRANTFKDLYNAEKVKSKKYSDSLEELEKRANTFNDLYNSEKVKSKKYSDSLNQFIKHYNIYKKKADKFEKLYNKYMVTCKSCGTVLSASSLNRHRLTEKCLKLSKKKNG
jgi:hypothetical protein